MTLIQKFLKSDITPIDMDGDGKPDMVKPTKRIREPKAESVSAGLLSRIKKELPAKVEAVTTEEVEEEIE
jgi:hypothetical protein